MYEQLAVWKEWGVLEHAVMGNQYFQKVKSGFTSGHITSSYHDYFLIVVHRSHRTSFITMSMPVDQINQHQTRTHQNISAWTRLEFMVVSDVVFRKTYCKGVCLIVISSILWPSCFSLQAIRCTPDPRSELKNTQGRQSTGPKTPGLGMSSLRSPNATGRKPGVSVWVYECVPSWLSQVQWLYAQWFIDTNLVALQGSIACAHTICCFEHNVNHVRSAQLCHVICLAVLIFILYIMPR